MRNGELERGAESFDTEAVLVALTSAAAGRNKGVKGRVGDTLVFVFSIRQGIRHGLEI